MKTEEKFIYIIITLIIFFISVSYFAPKFVDVPKTFIIAKFDKNTSIDIDLPRGSHYLFYLEYDKNMILNGKYKILHNNKIIYKAKLSNNKTTEKLPFNTSPDQKIYNLIPLEKALKLFQNKENYKFIFNFNNKPQNKLKLKLFYLSHW